MIEVALGGKTGHSRCLIEACEREWSMTLPNPVPLGSRAPIIQVWLVCAYISLSMYSSVLVLSVGIYMHICQPTIDKECHIGICYCC